MESYIADQIVSVKRSLKHPLHDEYDWASLAFVLSSAATVVKVGIHGVLGGTSLVPTEPLTLRCIWVTGPSAREKSSAAVIRYREDLL